jgi:hypothetical protein
MRFNPVVRHVPGKEQYISDALSRNPLPLNPEIDCELGGEVQAHVDAVTATWPASTGRKREISAETEVDSDLQMVRKYIENSWPAYASSLPDRLKPYYDARDNLSTTDGFITYGDRIVIPQKLQKSIIQKLHESHQGVNKCLDNAQAAVWWPGMTSQMTEFIKNCIVCAEKRPAARSEPLIPSKLPDRPWQVVSTDLFELNHKQYIVMIDNYSRWIEVRHLNRTTSMSVIKQMKAIFAIHGIPETVQSDNGTQYTSMEYKDFAKEWGFEITTSSPHFPQANGAAERSVQTCKKILSQADPALAMLNYRNTPHSATGISPASALMGRRLRTRIPILSKLLTPRAPENDIRDRDHAAKQNYKKYFDRRTGARPLPPLNTGQPVLVKRGKEEQRAGIVQAGDSQRRTSMIRTQKGIIRRNRKHLQSVPFYRETHNAGSDEFEDDRSETGSDDIGEQPENINPEIIPVRRSSRTAKKPRRLIEE